MQRIEALLRRPWFFGDISLNEAELKLEPFKKLPGSLDGLHFSLPSADITLGTFLVRLNKGTSESIEKTPYTISRISASGDYVHTRVYPSKKHKSHPGFWIRLKIDGGDVSVKQGGFIEDLIERLMIDYPSILRKPCAGYPYADLFSSVQKKGPYENAETSSEDSEADSF